MVTASIQSVVPWGKLKVESVQHINRASIVPKNPNEEMLKLKWTFLSIRSIMKVTVAIIMEPRASPFPIWNEHNNNYHS